LGFFWHVGVADKLAPVAQFTASNIATMFAGGTSAMMLWTCWKT
jgi:hypothetical protein